MAFTLPDLLLCMQPYAPLEVESLMNSRRKVEYGLTTVGLKIHDLTKEGKTFDRIVSALGNRQEVFGSRLYRHASGAQTLVLPPVGNARAAVRLLEALGKYLGVSFFYNRHYQIQVCSPGRLDPYYASILSIVFYLGSDQIRQFTLDNLTTTFSVDKFQHGGDRQHRGRRLALYDGAHSEFERNFEWWDLVGDQFTILPELPFHHERTDMLACQSQVDIHNVNLAATLLSQYQHLGWWEPLGKRFTEEVEALLERHLLGHLLHVRWIHPADGSLVDDGEFFAALQELTSYALDERARIEEHRKAWWRFGAPPKAGILAEMREILRKYRELLVQEADRLQAGVST